MAQAVPAASALPSGGLGLAKLSEKEVFELGQYEKIVQICDAIISGKHPTITLHRSSNASSDSIPPRRNVSHSEAPRQRQDNNGPPSTVPSQPEVTAQPELNPIVQEESDQLVKAELQIQRQRLERALKDEAEQRCVEKTGYAEPSSELDLSDVLVKALVIVQATAAPAADGEKLNANAASATDSFDESTFYSSRHDTPESHLVSHIRSSSEDVQATDVHPQHEESSQQPGKQPEPPSGPAADSVKVAHPPPAAERSDLSAANATSTSHMSIVPGLNNYVQVTGITKDLTQTVSGVGSQSDAPTQGDSRTSKTQMPMSNAQVPRDSCYETHPPSPLVRNHNTLQPIAPQPTHPSSVSALAATSSIVHGASHAAGYRSAVATPAQVAALRTEQHVVTSPDSSSQGGKKKGKKKKRKADKQGDIGTESVSLVKQEHRSPSPLNTPSYIRPSKRARHTQDQSAAHEYGPRNDPASARDAGAQFVSGSVRDHAIPIGHATTATYQRPYGSVATGEPRYSSGRYYEEQGYASEGPRHHDGLPIDHTTHYLGRPAPASGPVPQVTLAESRPMSSRPYREFQDGSRMIAHPNGETFVAPPRPAPARILVDAYGREYVEPSYHPSSRLSVASPSRHGDHEVVYERLPPRAVSRHPLPGSYEDGGVIYTAPPQTYALPRRIVTQPEYATRDYRDLRTREFSSRPLPAQGEFVQVLAPNERRYGEDGYGPRPASVRPVESVHYQMPPDYGRVHSVRPELPVAAEYRASVHPDSGREILQPYMRDYRPAPAQQPTMQRAYSVRPPDPPHSGQLRGVDESAFVERPSGATQEIVYADDGRREYYR